MPPSYKKQRILLEYARKLEVCTVLVRKIKITLYSNKDDKLTKMCKLEVMLTNSLPQHVSHLYNCG
jgi:hypothetical protein